ncbi:hypothetical protein JCM11251_002578 [Rhodosporidiobolus azoricus]
MGIASSEDFAQAHVTSPTRSASAEKSGTAKSTSETAGGRRTKAGQAQSSTSPTTPASGTPLSENRGSSSSRQEPSAVRRTGKSVFYGMQVDSESSELSEVEISSGESGRYRLEDRKGEEGNEEEDDAKGGQRLAVASCTVDAETWPSATGWTSCMNEALAKGIRLVPCLGTHRVTVGDVRLGRNGLLAEYVRRQTGVVLSAPKVHARLQQLRGRAQTELKVLLKGEDRDRHHAVSQKWSTLLGPDLYTNRSSVLARSTARNTPKTPKSGKAKPGGPSEPAARSSTTFTASAVPPVLQPATPMPPSPHFAPPEISPYSIQHPPTYAGSDPPPSSSRPLSGWPAAPAPRPGRIKQDPVAALPSTPLFPQDFHAFLSSFNPSCNFTLADTAVRAAGLSSLEDLVSFFAFEKSTFEVSVEQVTSTLDIVIFILTPLQLHLKLYYPVHMLLEAS